MLSVGGVLLLTSASRILGFAREVLISSQYGTSVVADTYFTVQQVPFIASAFMAGPFVLAYVPYYARLGDAATRAHVVQAHLRSVRRVSGVIGLVMALAGLLMILLEVGPQSDGVPLFGAFTLVLAPSIPLLATAGYATAVLNARGEHVRAVVVIALAPAGMLASLFVLTVVPIVGQTFALPASAVIGAATAALVGSRALWSRIDRSVPSDPVDLPAGAASAPSLRSSLSASALENIGFASNQALTVFFAGAAGAGAVAINAYTLRIASFAFSAIVSPLNQIVQTWLTRQPARGNGRSVLGTLGAIGGLVIAIVVGLVLFGRPIVELVYVRGAFSPDDANRVIALLPVYAAYIGVTAMNQLLARYFFVHHEGRRYTTFMLGAYVAANVLKPFLVVPFGLNGVVGASLICEGIVLVYFVVAVLVRERRATLD